MNSMIARWALILILASMAATGAMWVVRNEAAAPRLKKEVAQESARPNVVARATQMDKIGQALQGE